MRLLCSLGLVFVSVVVVGCSLTNKPSKPIGDASVDVPSDVLGDVDRPDVSDAGIDAEGTELCNDGIDNDSDDEIDCADSDCAEGTICYPSPEEGCVCADQRALETACSDGIDNDRDGTTDCADFDCASQRGAECCGEGSTPADWPDGQWGDCAAEWSRPSGGTLLCDGGEIREFFATDPFGIVWPNCLSLASGATLDLDVIPQGPTDAGCVDDRCDEHIKFLLAPRNLPNAISGLFLHDIGVIVHASGLIEVTQGELPIPGTGVLRAPLEMSRVTIELRPSTAETGIPVLMATVSVLMEPEPQVLWEGVALRLDELRSDNRCAEVPGLFAVLEGKGDSVHIVELNTTLTECTNPNLFEPSPDHILTSYDYAEVMTHTSLELDPPRLLRDPRVGDTSWADEAILSPSILRSGEPARWRIVAEATNDQPELEGAMHVGYAVAYRSNTTWNDSFDGWQGGFDTPAIGMDPPSCVDETCADPETPPFPSVRDPFLFEQAPQILVAFAREITGMPDQFAIHVLDVSALPSADGGTEALIMPTSECASLRDPVIVERPSSEGENFWLFFTCYNAPISSGIYAVPLQVLVAGGLQVVKNAGVPLEPERVLAAEDVGRLGRAGIRAGEVLVEIDESLGTDANVNAVFGLWFMAGNEVGLALGSPKSEFTTATLTTDLPRFTAFAGNPVLTPEDRVFRGCDDCPIEGLAVTRIAPSRLRFLIARQNRDRSPRRYEFVPLDQTWRNLAAQ